MEPLNPFEPLKKVTVKLIGEDGNVFNLLGITTKALKKAGQNVEAKEVSERVLSSGSYDEALQIIMEYVEVT